MLVILSRVVAPHEFGVVALATAACGLAELLVQAGVGPALVQKSQISSRNIGATYCIAVTLGCAAGVVLYMSGGYVGRYFEEERLPALVRQASIILPIAGLSVAPEALLRRSLRFRALSAIAVIGYTVGYGLIGAPLAVAGGGASALISARIGQEIVQCVLFHISARPRATMPATRADVTALLPFMGGFTLARIANYCALQIDNVIVGKCMGGQALGIYSRAYQVSTLPATVVGQVLNDVLFPGLARLQHDQLRLRAAAERTCTAAGVLTLPMAVFASMCSDSIALGLLGATWAEAGPIIAWLGAGMYFRVTYKVGDAMSRALGLVYRRAWRQFVYAGAVGVGAWIGQSAGSLQGVAVGVTTAIILNYLLMMQLIMQHIGWSWRQLVATAFPGMRLGCVVAGIVGAKNGLGLGQELGSAGELLVALVLVLIGVCASVSLRPHWFAGSVSNLVPFLKRQGTKA